MLGVCLLTIVWRLLLAAGLGAAIGLEREYRQKPAGLRTNILIAIGSALFTILSISMTGGHRRPEPRRRADRHRHRLPRRRRDPAQPRHRARHDDGGDDLGECRDRRRCGMGQYALATVTTALTLVVLVVLPPIEIYFERRAGWPDRHRRRRTDDGTLG